MEFPARQKACAYGEGQSPARTDIDRFLLAGMGGERIEAGTACGPPHSHPESLLRSDRPPPTFEEVNAFVKDRSFDAFAKVVDRLLASPRYGERWGRHWLDVARYADEMYSSTEDAPSPNAWRHRDWVVKAFNEDMPYDTFLKAQIAGDLIDSKNKEKLIGGLGFFSLSPSSRTIASMR